MIFAYPAIPPKRLSGAEVFKSGQHAVDIPVMKFWQWAFSDVISNATRGVLAEYIVALALGNEASAVRTEWSAYDLESQTGVKIEVKSSAYIQSWDQKRLSSVSFLVGKKRSWDASTGLDGDAKRHADVYVFALFKHMDQETANALDLDQWDFYVLHRDVLDRRTRSQHSITLRSLIALAGPAIPFHALNQQIEAIAGSRPV